MTKWGEEEKKGEEEAEKGEEEMMEEEGLGEEVLRVRKDLGGVPEEQRKPGGQRGEILPRRLHAAAACVNVHQQAALTGKSGRAFQHEACMNNVQLASQCRSESPVCLVSSK